MGVDSNVVTVNLCCVTFTWPSLALVVIVFRVNFIVVVFILLLSFVFALLRSHGLLWPKCPLFSVFILL